MESQTVFLKQKEKRQVPQESASTSKNILNRGSTAETVSLRPYRSLHWCDSHTCRVFVLYLSRVTSLSSFTFFLLKTDYCVIFCTSPLVYFPSLCRLLCFSEDVKYNVIVRGNDSDVVFVSEYMLRRYSIDILIFSSFLKKQIVNIKILYID